MNQPYIPPFNYCIVCGKETKAETCSKPHQRKLEKLRSVISEQIGTEHGRKVDWNPKSIKVFNDLQDILNPNR